MDGGWSSYSFFHFFLPIIILPGCLVAVVVVVVVVVVVARGKLDGYPETAYQPPQEACLMIGS